tara:strand:+ start:2086 stop:2343 length:258 start_codon:yes stop_codon:yes gene_type:complete
MAPIMFKYDRSYQTNEQRSLAIKSLESTRNPLTCAQKYSQYASVPSAGNTTGGSANAYRKITNCTKLQNVYINGKFIGRNFCLKF